jgi:hypothetical protein
LFDKNKNEVHVLQRTVRDIVKQDVVIVRRELTGASTRTMPVTALSQKIQSMPNVVAWKGMMAFGNGGNYVDFAKSGWSTPERNITWIDGYQATLEFSMPAPDTDQMLAVTAMPVQTNVVQQMYIYLNGRLVGLATGATRMQEFLFPINQEHFSPDGSRNTLAFVCPNAVQPAAVGAGPDQRTSSFAFSLLSLYPADIGEDVADPRGDEAALA